MKLFSATKAASVAAFLSICIQSSPFILSTIAVGIAACGTPMVLHAQEQEAERGRLPDGRAFRTDDEGNQLVDYIAELELEKEGLENRIFGLQDRVRDQELKISKISAKPEPVACPVCEQVECPELHCPKLEPVICPRIEPAAVVTCPTCEDRSGEIRTLERKIANLSSENSEVEAEKSSVVEELGNCQTQAAQFESTATSLQESLTDLRKALADRDTSLQTARAQVAQLREEQQRLIAMRPAVADSEQPRASLGSGSNIKTSSLSASALSAARNRLLARVSELKSQVRARDEQFHRIDQRGRSLQVKPSAIKTRSGFELNKADELINAAGNFKAIAELSRELDNLSRIVADDIRLGAKLGKR